jgi:hypothetical protein
VAQPESLYLPHHADNHSIDRECLHYLIGNLIAKKLKIKSLNLSTPHGDVGQNTIGDEGCEEFHN